MRRNSTIVVWSLNVYHLWILFTTNTYVAVYWKEIKPFANAVLILLVISLCFIYVRVYLDWLLFRVHSFPFHSLFAFDFLRFSCLFVSDFMTFSHLCNIFIIFLKFLMRLLKHTSVTQCSWLAVFYWLTYFSISFV